jgi:hypothetical protein
MSMRMRARKVREAEADDDARGAVLISAARFEELRHKKAAAQRTARAIAGSLLADVEKEPA